MTDFDTSEVNKLAADLGRIPGKMVAPMTAAVTKSGQSVRDAMRADAAGHRHAPYFPDSITAEVHTKVGQVTAEIGPDKGLRQGALGNLLYFGSSKNGPVLDINGPLDSESPALERAVADLAGKLLDG